MQESKNWIEWIEAVRHATGGASSGAGGGDPWRASCRLARMG